MSARKIVIGATVAAFGASVVAYGAWGKESADTPERLAALYKIDQIEKIWHKATSKKNLNLMMSIWAPNATLQGAGTTYTGKAAIRRVFAKAAPFQPQNHWISDTPAYKTRTTVNGNKGTLYYECHYIDVDTGKVVSVVGGSQDVQKIHGKWLIVHTSISSPTLEPLRHSEVKRCAFGYHRGLHAVSISGIPDADDQLNHADSACLSSS